jgi:predicted AAA+ superfamily ATPase
MGAAAPAGAGKTLQSLLILGGFPEPFLSGSETEAKRWRLSYGSRLIRQDIRDVTQLKDLDRVELLYDRLPETVGSVLSLNSLREDLEVGFQSVRNWVHVFEQMYSVFRIAPFGPSRIKAVKKEQKLYLWDWSRIADPGARLENAVAFHLLRLCHWAEDVHGERVELRFFRSVVGHEVDFVLLRSGKPWMAVEVKIGERPLSSGMNYFLQRVKTPFAFQLHLEGITDARVPDINGCRVRRMPVADFFSNLP